MEFLDVIMGFCVGAVCWKGGTVAVNGFSIFGEGKGTNNGARQEEGMEKMTGGAFVILAGLILVPQLFDWLKGLVG